MRCVVYHFRSPGISRVGLPVELVGTSRCHLNRHLTYFTRLFDLVVLYVDGSDLLLVSSLTLYSALSLYGRFRHIIPGSEGKVGVQN